MAEAVGLGASIIAFITITAQSSKNAILLYGSIKDAPEDLRTILARLNDMTYYLDQMKQVTDEDQTSADDPNVQSYWNNKSSKLKKDLKKFEDFTTALDKSIGGAKGRIMWFLSNQDRAKKISALLTDDINLLRDLSMLMSLR